MAPLATLTALSETWDEAEIAGTRDANLIDTYQQEHKRANRERMAVDHNCMATEAGEDNVGAHNVVHLLVQSTPSALTNAGCLYSKDVATVAELHYYDESENEIAITSLGTVKCGTKVVNEAAIGDGKGLTYDNGTGKIVYSTLASIPSGLIAIWKGAISAIPSGWVICDGNNGTPDLTDKFVIHADADAAGTHDVGDTGGAHTHTHTQNHLHSWTGVTPGHASGCGCGSAAANTTNAATGDGSATTHTPPYHALAFIMKS